METKSNYIGGYQSIYLFLKILNNKMYQDSNLYIELFICNDKKTGSFISLGKTEKAVGSEIIFQKYFLLDYIFEREQQLRILITCVHNPSLQYVKETTVANFMGTRNLSSNYEIKTSNGGTAFDLVLEAKNSKESQEIVCFNLVCESNQEIFQNLNKTKDCFFVIYNFTDGKNFRKIYKSEESQTQNLRFEEIQLDREIFFNEETEPLKIEFYDMYFNVFAVCKTSILEIKQKKMSHIFDPKYQERDIGILNFSINFIKKKTFIDYLSEGMQINLIIGIDFTASNGSPIDQISLHYCNSHEPNLYERAIVSCGEILNYYDYDKVYPVFGFGAKMNGSNIVNHCFNLNFTESPSISGIDNVINIYKENICKLNFSGPTYFTPLIRNVIEVVRNNMINGVDMTYYVLLILTDGQVI